MGNIGETVTILAVETSCDETAAAVVENGRKVLSNVISSQIDLHTLYGGVVPEIASRKHIEKINQVMAEALLQAGKKLSDMDAVAVTYGPGLWVRFWWACLRRRRSVLHRGFRWSACTTLKGISVQII